MSEEEEEKHIYTHSQFVGGVFWKVRTEIQLSLLKMNVFINLFVGC